MFPEGWWLDGHHGLHACFRRWLDGRRLVVFVRVPARRSILCCCWAPDGGSTRALGVWTGCMGLGDRCCVVVVCLMSAERKVA